jgi:malonyl-CoA/methylmalonyl-CoA synthetase
LDKVESFGSNLLAFLSHHLFFISFGLGEDPALILYTSGTTGKPKGVVHTHGSIIAQVQSLAKAWEYTSADQFLHCLPLHHVHGLFNGLLAPLYAGSTVSYSHSK